jgi:hypothetical protein
VEINYLKSLQAEGSENYITFLFIDNDEYFGNYTTLFFEVQESKCEISKL